MEIRPSGKYKIGISIKNHCTHHDSINAEIKVMLPIGIYPTNTGKYLSNNCGQNFYFVPHNFKEGDCREFLIRFSVSDTIKKGQFLFIKIIAKSSENKVYKASVPIEII